jgi:hypothetical protein
MQNDRGELRRANELAQTIFAEQFAGASAGKFLGIDVDEEEPRAFVGESVMEVLNHARRMDRIVIVAVREAGRQDWWLVRMEPHAFELVDQFALGMATAFLYVKRGEVPLQPAFFRKLDQRRSGIILFASREAAARISNELIKDADLVEVSKTDLQHLWPYVVEMAT